MQQTVRAAIIGTGLIGAVHRKALLAKGGVLEGLVGSSPQRGRERAER